MLHRTCPSGEFGPYRLKVNGWVVGPDHRKGVCNGGDSGITVEAFEVLPRRLAPINDGVWTWWPTVGLWSHLQVDTVKYRLDSDNYGIEFVPLGPSLLLQHIELRLGPPMIVCRHHKDPSNKRNQFSSNSDHEVLTF